MTSMHKEPRQLFLQPISLAGKIVSNFLKHKVAAVLQRALSLAQWSHGFLAYTGNDIMVVTEGPSTEASIDMNARLFFFFFFLEGKRATQMNSLVPWLLGSWFCMGWREGSCS